MKIYRTSYRDTSKGTEIFEGEFDQVSNQEGGLINLYPEVKYQVFYGFGGAITEASAYVYSLLCDEDKKEVINGYYGENGLGYTYGRLHLDSCDFCLSNYSAKEKSCGEFSLKRDYEYVIPFLKEIEKTKKLKYMMTPWSPPAYMKSTGERNRGGKLLKEYYAEWAEYVCNYLEGYVKEGFDVAMLSVQNEASAVTAWDSCVFTAEEEGNFLSQYLYPEMQRRKLDDIKRLVWDHNKDRAYDRLRDVLACVEDKACISGVAYHWYVGEYFDSLRMIYDVYPDMLSVFSEGCVEYSCDGKQAEWEHTEKYAFNILSCLKNGCNLFLDWNILLDNVGGPNHVQNYCAAPMMLDGNNRLIKKKSYDIIGHFSKHIKAGARRIATSVYTERLDCVAFENPDGRLVIIVLNRSEADLEFALRKGGLQTVIEIKAKTIVTIVE